MPPFPTSCALASNLDRSKEELAQLIGPAGGEATYSHVVMTVSLLGRAGQYHQKGSAPNFEGDRLTLCTGKYQMRARLDVADWPAKWIAGFSRRSYDGNHWLIYLAQVERAYESHSAMWFDVPPEVRQAKWTGRNKVGDMYEPMRHLSKGKQFDPSNYREPIVGHVHHQDASDYTWKDDIDYRGKTLKHQSDRVAPLLVGNCALTFLWQRPLLCLNRRHTRDCMRRDCLADFLDRLRSDKGFAGRSGLARATIE